MQSQRGQSQRAPARTVATWSVTWSVRRPWRLAPMEVTADDPSIRSTGQTCTNSGRVYRTHTSASDSGSLLEHNPLTHRNTTVITSPFESCTPSAHFGRPRPPRTPVGCRGTTRAQHVPANPAAAARVPDGRHDTLFNTQRRSLAPDPTYPGPPALRDPPLVPHPALNPPVGLPMF